MLRDRVWRWAAASGGLFPSAVQRGEAPRYVRAEDVKGCATAATAVSRPRPTLTGKAGLP